RLAERFFDDRDRRLGPEGLHPVLERGQLIGDLPADHVGPRREKLPELDVGGTELCQRARQRLRAAVAIPARKEICKTNEGPRRRRQQHRVEFREHAFKGENVSRAREAPNMSKAQDHARPAVVVLRCESLSRGAGGKSMRAAGSHATARGSGTCKKASRATRALSFLSDRVFCGSRLNTA